MGVKFGIASRLFLAFAGVAALSLLAGGIGWVVLRNVEQAQTTIVEGAMPAAVAAREVAEASAQIVARGPLLTNAPDQETRAAEAAVLAAAVRDLQARLDGIEAQGLPAPTLGELRAVASDLAGNLEKQESLVAERIVLDGKIRGQIAEGLETVDELSVLSDTLTSNAASGATVLISNLYELTEDPQRLSETLDALDRLVESDLFIMERMFEMRMRVAELGLLLNQLGRAVSSEEIVDVRSRFESDLRILQRRVAGIDDPIRRSQAGKLIGALQLLTARAADVFARRARVLELTGALNDLASDNRALSATMTAQVEGLVASSKALADRASHDAGRAVEAGVLTLVLQTLAFITIAGVIAWAYVRGNVIRRLTSLHQVMRRLAAGDLAVAVPSGGRDELTEMAGTLQVFKDQAVAKSELEKVRDRNEAELRRHRDELEGLVAERTVQLTETNERLVEEVQKHDEARSRAERASRAKTEFLAAMSHEIRTPMNGMLGMLRLLGDSSLTGQQRDRLKIVRSSGRILMGILNDILDYSKVESGEVQVEKEDFDLKQLIGDIAALMQGRARESGISLAVGLGDELPNVVRGDQRKLSQVLLNLLGNAIKFTDHGSVTLTVARTNNGSDRLRFEVIDTGPGIAEDERVQLFQPFYQAPSSRAGRHGGTGLGLAICRRLVVAMGGEIGVETEAGKGSRFWFNLPLEEGAIVAPDPDAWSVPAVAPDQRALAVLVIEDNAVNAMVVEGFLERMGHGVRLAETAEAGLELLEAEAFDLVLMDISLPGIDGLEATRRIRSHPDPGLRALPVIAMSAHVFDSEVAEHLESGMEAFVGKPLSPERLAKVIAEVMAGVASPPQALPRGGELDPQRAPSLDPEVLARDHDALGTARTARIVEAFEATAPKQLELIRRAHQQGDASTLSDAAHALKGAAAGIGLFRLAANCERLEIEPNSPETSALIEGLPRLVEESLALLAARWRELQTADSEAYESTGSAKI